MNILLVEDDEDSRSSLSGFLTDLGYNVTECEDGQQALQTFNEKQFDLVLTDIKMPRVTGIELLNRLGLLKSQRDFEVIIFTGHGDMESAINALRAGARDYLLKPINIQELASLIERLAESLKLNKPQNTLAEIVKEEVNWATEQRSCESIRKAIARTVGIGEIGILSEKTKEAFRQAIKLHEHPEIPVLIEGETGTGKEVIARLIHFGCSDINRPFVDINCAALTPTLFESELFGHEAGAYTGALHKGSKGKIDIASGGTLFLDEIGEMSIELQAKLLRVIQEKEFYRVGGLKKVKAQIRVICATNVNLEKRVEEGLFRRDLFYRLNVGRIQLPPLRERKGEIIPLAQVFLKHFALKKGKRFGGICSEASNILVSHNWPGNIRELRNLMEWVVFNYNDTELKPCHLRGISNKLPLATTGSCSKVAAPIDPYDFRLPMQKLPLEEYMNSIVLKALELNKGNKKQTAQYLGISRRSLYCRLNRIKENAQST